MKWHGCDEAPIRCECGGKELGIVLRRALNANQKLILREIDGLELITHVLEAVQRKHGVPLATLKLNAGILRNLGLITFGNGREYRPAQRTPLGTFIVKHIEVGRDDKKGMDA